jgi:hypothetical protein
LQQLEGDVHAHAHVRCQHQRHALRQLLQLGLLRLAEAGGADDQLDTEFGADGGMGQRALGPGEVDQRIGPGQAGAQVGGDGDAAAAPQKGHGVLPEGRAGGDVQRTSQHQVIAGGDGLDQHAAHAAGGTGDGNAAAGGGEGCVHGGQTMSDKNPASGPGNKALDALNEARLPVAGNGWRAQRALGWRILVQPPAC